MKLIPESVLLTSHQTVTFEAKDDSGQPMQVTWKLDPDVGTLKRPASPSASVGYEAPSSVSNAETITLVASSPTESANATIHITTERVVVVPEKVEIKGGGSQHFTAIIAGAQPSSATVTQWILAPVVGSIEEHSGFYKAPDKVEEAESITVSAIVGGSPKPATASIRLVAPPWRGAGPNWLGGGLILFVLLLFSILIAVWPPALPTAEVARADRLEAEKTVESAKSALKTAEATQQQSAAAVQAAKADANDPAKAQSAALATAKAEADQRAMKMAQLNESNAENELTSKTNREKQVVDPEVEVLKGRKLNREVDLILIVLLAGALGSFLHVARSFTEFRGNDNLKASWAWWYYMAPFTGAALALVFYATLRAGFLALNAGANNKPADLSTYAVASVAAIVGMFSKVATTKLGEVFNTLFNARNTEAAKDKLVPTPQAQPGAPARTPAAQEDKAAAAHPGS